jgi:hypothetical protein
MKENPRSSESITTHPKVCAGAWAEEELVLDKA